MFCPLLSRVNRAEIAQLPTLPEPQNALDVTACWGAKLLLCDYWFICSGLGRRLGLALTTEVHWDRLDWAVLEQNQFTGPKVCGHTSALPVKWCENIHLHKFKCIDWCFELNANINVYAEKQTHIKLWIKVSMHAHIHRNKTLTHTCSCCTMTG